MLTISNIFEPRSVSSEVIPVDSPVVVSAETDSNIEFKKF